MTPSKSIQTLLRGILDYAGLFPPAGLGMTEAAANYARYRDDARSWMLSRFICPAGRLPELEQAAGERWQAGGAPWSLSVLGRGADSPSDYLKGLREDLDRVAAFRERRDRAAVTEVLELPLPPIGGNGDPDRLRDILAQTMSLLTAHSARPEAVFFEIGFGLDWDRHMPAAILAVSEHSGAETAAGVKIRTGGLTAQTFPSVGQVAAFVTAARDTGVFFKATAGLHHPLRRHDEEIGASMHGFLNVFGGAVLAHTLDLDRNDLRAVLEDEDPDHFEFDEDGLSWNGERIGIAEIEAARASFAVSFGSCSFTEPVEDLESLGLI
jgi:hypothetical protein